jgi:hypothetical protein
MEHTFRKYNKSEKKLRLKSDIVKKYSTNIKWYEHTI